MPAAGVRFRVVLADADHELSAPLRQGLSAQELVRAVGIPHHQKVYPAEVGLICPVSGRGRPRQQGAAERGSRPGASGWRTGRRSGSATAAPGTGREKRPGWSANTMHPASNCYLSNLPPGASLKALVAAIKARWVCEQAHQQMKEEPELDHFEGRS